MSEQNTDPFSIAAAGGIKPLMDFKCLIIGIRCRPAIEFFQARGRFNDVLLMGQISWAVAAECVAPHQGAITNDQPAGMHASLRGKGDIKTLEKRLAHSRPL